MPSRYVYCSGVKGFKNSHVPDSGVFNDASYTLNLDEIYNASTGPLDFGLFVAYADRITFEVEISAPDESELVAKLWNSQWDFVFLSVIADVAIDWMFSGSTSLQHGLDDLRLAYPHGFLSKSDSYHTLSDAEVEKFCELRPVFFELIKEKAVSHSASILAIHSFTSNQSIALAMLWSGIEAILGFESELRFRISLALSIALHAPLERKTAIKKYQRLYDARSKSVHGTGAAKGLNESAIESRKVLRDLLLAVVAAKKLPTAEDWNNSFASGLSPFFQESKP